ncbi:insulinase family protein [Clostridium sp. 19966]|uniref:M16 family metallopeptidase n=1 Tax=Clostridium sp. 19966 TaxID=2768166 RepID=UPI0028DE4446|nr:pitrilysin family protein [Clostridium sp. 19966]MDT8719579.1 insulinase family protein [Clostridium sp. 19966]
MYDLFSVYLENGLKVIMHRIPTSRNIACGLWVKQGCKDEDDLTNGLSHLIKHLVFHKDNCENERFQKLVNFALAGGVVLDSQITKEYSSFYMTGLPDMIENCIETLGSMVTEDNFDFSDEFIEREKKTVLKETIKFYSSFEQMKDRTSQALWGNVGIGRIVYGEIENIKRATKRQLLDIISASYTPSNSTLVIIGNIDYILALEFVNRYFGSWRDKASKRTLNLVNDHTSIYFNENCGDIASISVGFRTPAYNDEERINLEIIADILGEVSLQARLVREMRIKRGVAYSIESFTDFFQNNGTLGFKIVCDNKNVNDVINIMTEELQKIRNSGFTDREINRAKKSLETRRLIEMNDIINHLKLLGKSFSYEKIFSPEQEAAAIRRIEKESLHNTFNSTFVEENMGFAAVGNFNMEKAIAVLRI